MDLTSGKARVLEGAGQLKGKLPVHSGHHGSGASGKPSSVLGTFHGLSPSTSHLSGVCAEPISAHFTDEKSEAQRLQVICQVLLTALQRWASWDGEIIIHFEADPGNWALRAPSPGISRISDGTCQSNAKMDPRVLTKHLLHSGLHTEVISSERSSLTAPSETVLTYSIFAHVTYLPSALLTVS